MPVSLACPRVPAGLAPAEPSARERGPAPYLTLAACREAGCDHAECARAEAAQARLARRAGSARRLQALAVMGHSTAALGARLGVTRTWVHHLQHSGHGTVSAELAAAISALYDELWDVRGPSARSARVAARRGWAPALAWDDNCGDAHWIDDPAAVPVGRRVPAGRPWGTRGCPKPAIAGAGRPAGGAA
jgi:hypothetical protein